MKDVRLCLAEPVPPYPVPVPLLSRRFLPWLRPPTESRSLGSRLASPVDAYKSPCRIPCPICRAWVCRWCTMRAFLSFVLVCGGLTGPVVKRASRGPGRAEGASAKVTVVLADMRCWETCRLCCFCVCVSVATRNDQFLQMWEGVNQKLGVSRWETNLECRNIQCSNVLEVPSAPPHGPSCRCSHRSGCSSCIHGPISAHRAAGRGP